MLRQLGPKIPFRFLQAVQKRMNPSSQGLPHAHKLRRFSQLKDGFIMFLGEMFNRYVKLFFDQIIFNVDDISVFSCGIEIRLSPAFLDFIHKIFHLRVLIDGVLNLLFHVYPGS